MQPKGGRKPAHETSCPSLVQIPERFTAGHVRQLAQDPAIKTVEDFLACLTRDLKLQTLLLHTSFAAQNSDSKNPRVLLLAADKRKIDGIFSVNSGEKHLNQNNSIEFMFNNKQKGEVEFYDIEINNGHVVMSSPNPETCLSCHGVDLRVPIGGPKLIFDRDPWSRVVHAGSGFSPQADTTGNGFCENRRRLHYPLEQQALQAFENKPRYRSLVSMPKTNADEMDFIVRDLNSRRIAKWIVQTPAFQEYKWAIFAAAYFCVSKAADVFSPSQIARMTGMHTLDKGVIQARDSFELERFVVRKKTEHWKQSLGIDAGNVALLAAVQRNEPVTVGLPNIDDGGQCKKPLDPHEGVSDASASAKPIDMMERFIRDSEAAGGDREIGIFRYIFESRGLDISDWSTQPTPGYGRGPGRLRQHLMELEPKDSPDYPTLKDAMSRPQFEACPRLRSLAKQHFK